MSEVVRYDQDSGQASLMSHENGDVQREKVSEQALPETLGRTVSLAEQKAMAVPQCESPLAGQSASSDGHDGDIANAESEPSPPDSHDSQAPQAEMKPEQTTPPLFSSAEKHLMLIQKQLDEAKSPASYETYESRISEADKGIRLFAARRIGESHGKNKTPCQDYCLATSVKGCTILADADGVGSCEHSDVGSKLACEAVVRAVEAAAQSCDGEEEFVRRLLTISFRDRLVRFWIEGVFSQIEDNSLSASERLKELEKYGSTIMFAVITEQNIVVGNLGDGQVLVFNDHYGVKLRLHAPKYDTRVRCLINPRCVREDFLVARYPREFFNGVLLSSDGMYESFDKGNHFFTYAVQMKERFLGRTPPEPYQPFCYKEEGEPFKDFSRMRTQDDCSIALALDERNVTSDYEAICGSVLQHAQAMLLERWSPDCLSIRIWKDGTFADVVVSKKEVETTFPDKLASAVLDAPEETWSEGGFCFAKYADTKLPTIEFMRCSGMLRRDRHNPSESAQRILKLFLQLRNLQKELSGQRLELNASALFNISFDGNKLHIRREAVKVAESDQPQRNIDVTGSCFGHLLGMLESGEIRSPVFDIGYIDDGQNRHYRFTDTPEELAKLVRKGTTTHLKNVSLYPWRLADGKIMPCGESLELAKKMTFTLLGGNGEELETYNFVSKELL